MISGRRGTQAETCLADAYAFLDLSEKLGQSVEGFTNDSRVNTTVPDSGRCVAATEANDAFNFINKNQS